MTKSRSATARSLDKRRQSPAAPGHSDRPIGSDLAKVDAHIITREEYEEIPEIDEDVEMLDLYHGDKLIRRGRPRSPAPKQLLTLRLAPDLIEHFRAKGPGWQTRIEDILRAVMSVERDAAEREAAKRR
jgi:uncharacterized protein (DUF4415 family)